MARCRYTGKSITVWIIPKVYELSRFVPDTPELKSDLNESAFIASQSFTWRGKPMPSQIWFRKSKRVSWLPRLFGRMLRPSISNDFADAWISSLADTRASRSAKTENVEAKPTSGICGRSLQTEFGFCDRDLSFSKTSTDTFLTGCATFFPSWSRWIIDRRSDYSARQNAARLTYENAFSFWPTPTTAEGCKIPSRANYGQKGLSNHPAIVGKPLREKMNKDGRSVDDWNRTKKTFEQTSINILPDHKAINSNGNSNAVLNADWVEQMMGVPAKWTALNDCDYSATESFPTLPR